jgi:two-component system, cell cycle sensor histidine kinase and response regulator CckA
VTGDDVLLSGVIDQLPLGVWIARAPGGELLFANRMFREIMGIEARDDVGVGGYTEPYGIFTKDGAAYPEERLPFVQAMRARATITVDDIVIHRRDGRHVNVRATARPLFDGDTVTHVVIAFADITEEVAAAERGRTRERLEAIGTLAAGVAHDFNNLLAQIRVLAALLRLRETDGTRVDDLARIEQATDSAAELTRSLLAFGRHPTGRTTRFDLDEVVVGVVDLLRRTFDRRIAIEVATAGGAPVAGDRNQLEQVIMNLAVNARDAMPDGGTLRIAVRAARGTAPPPLAPGPHIVVDVMDTGPGVPAEIRPRVFEPYFTTKHERDAPGTGLGLATVYGVVQGHGGAIEVGDALPSGARFTMYLPAAAAAPVSSPPARRTLATGHGRVLLVDDEPLLRRSVRRVLEHLGYGVIEAGDGAAAVESFRKNLGELAAVVLDHGMPVMSGGDAFRAMQEVDPTVPVILTSGRVDAAIERELRALGVAAVVSKPFDVEQLSQVLRSTLGESP